jgi:hypothetical protein
VLSESLWRGIVPVAPGRIDGAPVGQTPWEAAF